MALALYMDHHIPKAVTNGLRLRGVDVLTAFEDGASETNDAALLGRASELNRVLFTQDDDLLREAARCLRDGTPFHDLIYAHQMQVSIGMCVHDPEIIARAGEPEDIVNKVQYLPM